MGNRVSVVIPCFNAERWIRETLRSAASQDVSEIEIIAVDDGSTDETPAIIENEFENVRLLRTDNRGPSHARNLGTQVSRGRFIQYLDSDDLLAPGKVNLQLARLQESRADVAYGAWQEFSSEPDGASKLGRIVKREMKDSPELELFGDFWCPPAAYLFRRSIIDKVGGWNPEFPIIQDARFVLDCALQGGHFVYTPEIVAYYRRHLSGSVSTRDPKGFVRDCFKNAVQVEQWWMQHGGVDEQRRAALLNTYGYVTRQTFANEPATFDAAYMALERLMPGYVPDHPRPLTLVSRLLGYKRAEAVAASYRKAKRIVRA